MYCKWCRNPVGYALLPPMKCLMSEHVGWVGLRFQGTIIAITAGSSILLEARTHLPPWYLSYSPFLDPRTHLYAGWSDVNNTRGPFFISPLLFCLLWSVYSAFLGDENPHNYGLNLTQGGYKPEGLEII